MADQEALTPKDGGYRKLEGFQIAQLACDMTVRFCDRHVERHRLKKTMVVAQTNEYNARPSSMSILNLLLK